MNILEVQEALKNMSEQQLVQEVQRPSGNAPVFLVATELDRRRKMKARYNKQQPPQSTVVEDLVGGIGAMMPMQKSASAPFMGRPVKKMALGGLAGLGRAIPRGFLGRQTERLSDLSPIPKGQGIVPYVAGTSRVTKGGGYAPQMGFFGPKNSSLGGKALRAATLSSPFGLGAFFASPTNMGDGTLAGAYGLTQDEFDQVLQYMMQNGLDFPTNSPEFADLAAQLTGKDVPRLPSLGVPAEQRSQEAARVQAQQQEDEIKKKQAETKTLFDQIAEMDERRRKQALQLGIARAGLAAVGQPNLMQALKAGGKEVLDSVQESSKPSSLQSFIIKEKIKKMIAGGDKNLQNVLKFRQELGKLFGDTMEGTPERKQLADQIKQLDLMIAQMLGLPVSGSTADLGSLTELEISRRQASQ